MHEVFSKQARALAFLHLHKTGGTALRQIICNKFPVRSSLIDAHLKSNNGIDPNPYALVTGHFGFDYLNKFRTHPIVMTVLRDPLERAVSAYYFYRNRLRADPTFIHSERPAWRNAAMEKFRLLIEKGDIDYFVHEAPDVAEAIIGNAQTRYLAGAADQRAAIPEADLLARARRNLESCEIPGVTARLADTVEMLCRRMGWPPIHETRRDNMNPDRPPAADLDKRTLAQLQKLVPLDAALYRFAEQQFEQRLQSMRAEYPLRTVPIDGFPPAGDFTFDQPIYGHGWYEREAANGAGFCWSGPGTKAVLELALPTAGAHRLEIGIHAILDPLLLAGLTIRVNHRDIDVTVDTQPSMRVLRTVPAPAIDAAHGLARIELELERTIRPCDIVAASPDRRALGIAVSRVRLVPIQ